MPDHALVAAGQSRAIRSPITRPSQLAAIMRPELPDLTREIIAEIRSKIPEYARPMDGPYGHVLRVSVQQALTSFFDSIVDPSTPHGQRDRICRVLGQYEAREGRSLDSLQAAYRIGVQVSWRRVSEVGLRCAAPTSVISRLGDAALVYMDQLASLSQQGYLEAKARSAQSRHELLRRLLHLIVERPPAPARAIAELAELVGWTVPDEVTLIALDPECAVGLQLPDEALPDLDCPQPHFLLPGRITKEHHSELARMLAGHRAAVGIGMPVADAAHSLRWARRALAMDKEGVIGDRPITFCEDYLVELLLFADDRLIDQIEQRRLGALAQFSPTQRQRLSETFAAWLETNGTAPAMAERLDVHPQTVRYRMRQLQRALGGQLTDPDARFAIEVVLRATRLRDRAPRGKSPQR